MQIIPDDKKIYDVITAYKEAFSKACMENIPDYPSIKDLDTDEYVKRLKHYHPFQERH